MTSALAQTHQAQLTLPWATLAEGPSWLHRLWFTDSAGASTQAAHSEWLFMFILWVNIISFAVVMGLMFYFMFRYRRSKQSEGYQVSSAHNTPLELAWSIIPLLVMVPIFYWGFEGYVGKLAAPADAEDISVRGQKWNWTFKYKNGAEPQSDPVFLTATKTSVPEFIVPAGRPVRLVMSSADVLHAFYIPDFRTKLDVIPNRYISMWFQANEPGVHKVFCAEYCGDFHSEMGAQLRVVPRDEYEKTLTKWVSGPNEKWSPVKYGEILWARKGCNACHTIDGKAGTGPTWKNLYGDMHNYTNNENNMKVDENWLRENILYSQRRLMVGFPASMPVYAGQLTDTDVDALIWYIKSLSDSVKPEMLQGGQKTFEELKKETPAKSEKK